MGAEHDEFLTRRRLPEMHPSVRAGRSQILTIRRKGDRLHPTLLSRHPTLLSRQSTDERALGHVPQPDGAVVASRGQYLAIRGKGDTGHRRLVISAENAKLLASGGLP